MKKNNYLIVLSCLIGHLSSAQSFNSFLGGSGTEAGLYKSSITPSGGVYMYGKYKSSFTIDGITKTSEPYAGVFNVQPFIAFIDKDNKLQKLKNVNFLLKERGFISDNNGDLIVTENIFQGSQQTSVIRIDADTVKKVDVMKTILFSKFDNNLNIKFIVELDRIKSNNTGIFQPVYIDVDKNNNVYAMFNVNGGATNTFTDSVKIGNYKFFPDNFNLIKFSPNGDVIWHKPMFKINASWDALNVNSDGEIFLGGRMNYRLASSNSFIDFGNNVRITNNTLTNSNFDLFYAKFNTNGVAVWAKNTGKSYLATSASFSQEIPSIKKFKFDSQNNVFLDGTFKSEVFFGKDTLKGIKSNNPFFVKIRANGDYVWGKTIKIGAGDLRNLEKFDEITIDDQNNFYFVLPIVKSDWSFGDSLFIRPAFYRSSDQLILKLDSNFKLKWYRRIGNSEGNNAWSLKVIDNVIHYVNHGSINLQAYKDLIVAGGISYANFAADPEAQGKTTGSPFILKLNAINSVVTEIPDDFNSGENVLYPNPTSEKIYTNSQLKNYSIFNSLGAEIEKGTVSGNSINVSQLDNGIYHLQLSGKESRMKFIKQ